MEKNCSQCSASFVITPEDLSFYEKVSPVFNGKKELIPSPTHCPDCRRQRRLAFRNERNLYHRKCDLTGKQMISQYADKSLKVYMTSEWWGDGWDPLSYGRDFDFNRSFFEQFSALMHDVPHMCVANDTSNVNSEYANQTSYLKNCYLVFDSDETEDSLYLHTSKHSTSCVDCLRPFNSELCYECVDCVRCNKTFFSHNCENCTDSYFLVDCKGCKNCFGCANLRNKEYCIFNEFVGKEEYEKRVREFNLSTHQGLSHAKKEISSWLLKQPTKSNHNLSVDNGTGDFLSNVQNVRMCFDCNDVRDCAYCTTLTDGVVDCMDYDIWGFKAELLYEVITSGLGTMRVLFSNDCWSSVSDLLYCDNCFNSSNLFGCVGLKKNKYCILNKQYSKEEYETLVPKIIEHMRKTGEWGEFFPHTLSLFGYNESMADDYFPLEREEIESKGWRWFEEEEKTNQYMGPAFQIPDDIKSVTDDLCKQILTCELTGKPYKIIPQELKFYREMNLPMPRVAPNERHRLRMQLRNPRKIWKRQCAKCQKDMETTYAPDRPEIVYCEECYLATVY